jgi:hypothetical protein
MKYTEEELNLMIYALDDAIDEIELTLNIVENQSEAQADCLQQLKQLENISILLNKLKHNESVSN